MNRPHRRSSLAAVALGVALLPLFAACSAFGAEDDEHIPLDECPVTQATTGGELPGQRGEGGYHHDGEFWVTLPVSGTFELIQPEDGGLPGTKLVWWRPEPGVPLEITGRRLDGPAGALETSVPDGYAGLLQATGIRFPEIGCWEITGRAAGQELTFVAHVEVRDE